MGHEFEYHTLSNELPEGVIAAYDGMKIALNNEKQGKNG